MGKDTRTPREMINTLLTSNSPTILNRVQEVMKKENVQPYEARNLLYLDAINYFEQNKTLAPVNSLYTGERTKLYPLFMEKNKDFVSIPKVYDKVEESKKDFKKQTGKDLNFVAQYDKSTGKIVTTKPILKATTDWNNDSSVAGYLFGDDSDFAYDKDLTIKAYNELGFVKGGQLKDYNAIVKQLDMDKKKKFLVEEKRAEIHNRNIEMSKVKSKYDIGQPNEQGNEVLKWMNNSLLIRPVFKAIVEPSSGAGRGQLAKDLKVFNSADYTEGQLQKSIQKNSFVADKVNFGEDNEKSRQFNDIANIATQGLLSSFEFGIGVGIVNKTAKAITWASKLPFMGKTIPNVVDKVLKPVSWVNAKTYQDLGISKVAGTGLGGKIAQQVVVFPAKLASAFGTSAIYFGGIQKGVNKAFNPQLRNSDPNISSFQQGVRDVIEGGLEGLTEQLVFFPALKLTGKAITKSIQRKAFNLATGVISENFEEEVSNVVSDYFDLMYKDKWGGTSVIANAINGDKISQEQVNQVLGVALSTTALMGMFGSVSKLSEYMYNKEMVKTVEDLVKKHLSLDKVAQTLNDNFSGDYRDKLIMRNAMEESQILQQAFKKGLATGNATFGDKDYLNTVLSSGFNELSQLESLGFLGDMNVEKVQGIVDNIVNDVVESVPALKAFKKKTNDSKTLSYLVGNILQGRELTESQIKEDLKNTPDIDNIVNVYKESVTSIKNSEKKGQLNVLNTEIKEIDSQLSYLEMLPDDSGKKFAVEKKTKQRDELVKTREAVLNDDMLLSDVIDPLLVFAQYSAKKNREFITQNNLNEELFNKAEEILQTSTPYSRKVDVAVEYLTAVKKNIEEKITSGELIGQRQKQIYTETVNQLKRYDYLETMKGNTELKTNYDILVPEVEYFKTNPEEYAKTKELYLNTVISRMFDEVPTDKEWNTAKNKFIKHMEQYAKDGKSTVDALTEFFGDKYTEDIQNTVDYLYRLHKAVNTTKKTPVISSNATSKTTSFIAKFSKKGKEKPVALPTNIDNKSDFTENEEGKWYKRTMLLNGEGVDLFLLRNKITLSEQVKKAIMEFENTLFTESELEQWIKFKEEFINAYENNEPMDGELLKEYKFASAFLPIFYYLEKVVDVNNDGKLYESESLKSKSIAGKSSVYSQLYHNVAYFLGSTRVTSNGNLADRDKLEKEVLRSNPIERVQKLVDKYAPVKEDTAEEITAQNELLNSLEDIKQFQDFQKKYPNNLEVKKILFVYEIAKGRTPNQFDGVINQDRVLEILEKFNLSVKEKLRVLTKGTLVGKGELVDNLNNVPDVENEILSEEIKKELLKKLPKEILTNDHIELLTELTSNRYVSSEAQKMLDDYNKKTEVEIKKDSPFESSNAIENLMDDISSLKNYPTFRGVLRGIIVDSNFDLKLFSKIEKTPANLKEIRIFIGKLAIAFTKEQMIENRNNTKFIYYSMLKQIQKTNPELLHKVKLNGEDVFLVKEEEGFDEVVEASVDNKGNVSLRRIVSPSNMPVEAPNSPVEPQTPEEAIVTPLNTAQGVTAMFQGIGLGTQINGLEQIIKDLKNNNGVKSYTSSNKAKYDTILALNLKAFSDYFPNETPNIVETQNGADYTFELSYSPEQIKVLEDAYNTLSQNNQQNITQQSTQQQTPVEAIVTLPQKNQSIVEARQKLKDSMTDFYRKTKQTFNEDLMVEGALAEQAFKDALAVGANELTGHGMAKSGARALMDLFKIFDEGIDQNRNNGVGLYTAPLAVTEEQKGLGAGIGTGDGTAYKDGIFILVAKSGKFAIKTIDDIGGILVNPAFASQEGVLDALRNAFPNLVIESYSNATEFVRQMKSQNASINAQEGQGSTIYEEAIVTSPQEETPVVESIEIPTSLIEVDFTSNIYVEGGANEKLQVVSKDGIYEVWDLAKNPEPQLANIRGRIGDIFDFTVFRNDDIISTKVVKPAILDKQGKILSKGILSIQYEKKGWQTPQIASNTSSEPQGDTNTEEGIVSTPVEETKPVEEKQTTYIEMSEGVKGYLDKTEKELEELYNNIDRTSTKTNDELVLNVQLFISSYILLRNFDLEDVTNTKEYENLVNKYDPLAQEVLELIEKIDPKIYQEIIDKWFSGKENDFLFGFMADESKSNIEPFVEPSNIVTEEFTNEVVAKSIRSQYNFRNFKQRNGNIDVDSKTDSYFIAVPLKEHIDLAKITDNKRLKLFTNLISRIRINNNLYLEDNPSKMMILYSELIDTVNDISKAELTEEEFKVFKQIIKAAVGTDGLNIDLVLKYLSGVTYTNEEMKIDTLNTISRNIIKDEKVSIPTVLSMSITDLQNTNNLMYQGYYNPKDQTMRVVKTIQDVAVHEYMHYLFDFYNVKDNEEFKTTDKIVENKTKEVIRLIKAKDQLGLSKIFDNLSANTAMEFAKHLITAFDVATLTYANQSATERVANLFSNPIYAHMLYAIKYENGSLATPYLTNILTDFVNKDFADTLINEYLNSFEVAIKTNYKPNVSGDDKEEIIETPLPDFADDVDLEVDLYGGFLTQTVQPELIDWSVSEGVKDFNTFNEDEADIIANSLKDINEDLRIAKGIDEGGNIFDLVQNISFDEFYSLVQKPLDTLKEDDPDMYNARMNLYSKFTKILHNKFGNNSHIDYSLFKTGVPLLDQENYVKRLLHDVYNKLNSVVYQPIFQIIAKETQVAHQMDFIIKPLQKGRNADGESVSNYRPNMKIIEDMEKFKLVLNKIAGMNLVSSIKFKYLIDVLGKHLGESGDPNYAQSLFDENRPDNFRSEMYRTMTLIEQKDGGIFLNKFGDKNHHPVMYLSYSKKQMEKLNENQKAEDSYSSVNAFYTFVALPVYKKYRAMGIEDLKKRGVPNPETKFLLDEEIESYNPLVVSLAMRALWEEVKKGATQDNFEVVGKEITIKTKLKDENMITLMKRATLALEKMKMTVSQESLEYMNIDKVANIVPYQLIKGKDNLSSVVHNGKDVFFRVAFVSTKTMPPELVKLFRNKYGTFRFDGASFVVRQHFDSTYSELFGVLNEGAAKNVILPLNAFIKHAVHAIDANDTIGKWMLENNIAMLVFDESEKNKILRNENESLSRDLDTGQSVQDDSGFVSNQITDIFDLEGKTTDNPVNTYFLNIKDISRIGEKYSNETEVKALQQILNSSGLTTVNKSLGENGAKLITIMSKFSSSFADNINEFIKNVDADDNLRSKENPLYFEELISIITKHLYHIAKSPTGSLTANFAEVFDVVVYMYEKKDSKGKREISDIQIYEFMKQFAYMPLVSEAMDNFMNEVMSPNISYETKGKSLAVTPDLGRLSMPRIEGMKKAYAKQLEYDLKENPILKEFRERNIREKLSMLPADDPNRLDKAIKLANQMNKEMTKEYDAIKADKNAEDGTLEKRKSVIQNKVKDKSEQWFNKVLDEDMFIKRDYCYLPDDVAKQLNLKVGDKVLVTIIPSAGGMEVKGLTIAGILNSNGNVSPGTIVVNHEWFQGIGRDFDIDVLNIVTKPKSLSEEEWNFVVDEFQELEKKYVEVTYNTFKEVLGEEYINKQLSKYPQEYIETLSALDRKMLIAFNDRVFTDYQKKFLGATDTFRNYYSVVENATLYLGDNFRKDVGYVIVLRTLHQYLASTRLNFKLDYIDKDGSRVSHTVDFGNKEVWNKVHISLMIGTQHQVDYPKTTSKDEYDFRAESYFAKMLGFDKPLKDLPEGLQDKINDLYQVFSKHISALRIPKYEQKEWNGITLNKFENANEKIKAFKTLQETLLKKLVKIDGVTNPSFSNKTPLNPYIAFASKLNSTRMDEVAKALRYPKIENLHTYTKVIEYKILGKFLTDLEFPFLDMESLPYIEENLKLVAQYMWKIEGADKNGEPIIIENQDGSRGQTYKKIIDELRTKGYVDSIYYSDLLTSKSNTNPRLLPFLDGGSLRLFAKQNLQSTDPYLNSISYTQAMFFEGVKDAAILALRNGYKIVRKRIEKENNKQFNDKTVRSFLVKKYGLPEYPFKQLSDEQKKEMFTDEILSDVKKYTKRLDESDSWYKKTAMNLESSDNYYNYVTDLLGMTEVPMEDSYSSSPKLEHYIFDFSVTTDELFVTGFTKGLFNYGLAGTFDPITSTAQKKTTTAETIKRQKEIYEITRLMSIMNQVISQKDTVTAQGVINTRQEVANKIGMANINSRYWSEIGKSIIGNPTKISDEFGTLNLQVDENTHIEVIHKGDGVNYKLVRNNSVVEEFFDDLQVNSEIYKTLGSKAFWSNSYQYKNKIEVKKFYDLQKKDTFSIDDRVIALNKIMGEELVEKGLAERNETGLIIPSETAKRYISTALKWMVGFNEITDMTDTLYIPGVSIDNRILLRLMRRWSPETLFEYLQKWASYSGVFSQGTRDMLEELHYSYYDFDNNANKKPRRMSLEHYWDERRKSHQPQHYLKENNVQGGFMYAEGMGFTPKKFETLDTTQDIEDIKEAIVELAKDVNVLKTTAISNNPMEFATNFKSKKDINAWLDNSMLNIEKHIRDARIIETLKAIYIDLQLIKQSYDFESTKPKDDKVASETQFLTWLARGRERPDFTLYDDFRDDRMRLAARIVRFDKFDTGEWTEEEQKMKAFIDMTEKRSYANSEERLKDRAQAYEYEAELKRRKKNRLEEQSSDYYLINPKEAFILSQGGTPFNTQFSGLRPFGLMSLNYSKMRLLVGDLNVASQKIKGLVKEITNIVPYPAITTKINQSFQDRLRFDADVYEMSDKTLGKILELEIKENNKGMFEVKIGDKKFYQNSLEDTFWIKEIGKLLNLPKDDYSLAILYSAIRLRSLFDFHLRHYISRVNYYLDMILDLELADDSTLFKNEIEKIRKKYEGMKKAFQRFEKKGDRIYAYKVTPKVFLANDVINTYAEQRYSSRMRYYDQHLDEFEPKEKERVLKLIAEDGVKPELEKEIRDRVGGSVFYVPLFSYMRDNDLGNHFPSLEMMEEHIFGALFKMIESDISTAYYYQSRIYGMRNATPEFDTYHLGKWFEQFSDALDLKNNSTELNMLEKDQYVFFYTMQFNEEGNEEIVIKAGKVNSSNQDYLEITGFEGERVTYTKDEVFVSDFNSINKKIVGKVYVNKKLDYFDELEKKITFDTASESEKAIYYGIRGMSELFVSTQMLGIGALRTFWVNKVGGNINMLTFAGMSSNPNQIFTAFQGKVGEMPKVKSDNFNRFLSMANSMTGLQPLDVSMGSANVLGMDLPVFSKSVLNNIKILYNLRKQTQAFKGVEELKKEIYRVINKLNNDVKNGDVDVADAQDTKAVLLSILRSASYGLNMEIFGLNEIPDTVQQEDADSIYELFEKVYNDPNKMANLYGLTEKEINKAIRAFAWRGFKKFGGNFSKSPEEQLRTSSFFIGHRMALENGATMEEADLWGVRFTDMSQVVYDRFARKIGTDDVWKGFQYLMSNYAHQQQMYLNVMLDEAMYNKLVFELDRLFDYRFDEIKLTDENQVIFTKKISKLTKKSEFKTKIRKMDLKGKSIDNITITDNIGVNTLNRLIKILTVTCYIDYFSKVVSGLQSIQNPVIAPFLAMINLLISYIDDGEIELRDFIWTFNMLLGMKFGVGIGMMMNMATTIPIELSKGESLVYSIWSSMTMPIASTRVGNIFRSFRDIDLNQQVLSETMNTANMIIGSALGLKINAYQLRQMPIFANLETSDDWYNVPLKLALQLGEGVLIQIPGGSMLFRLLYDLPEYNRALDKEKKNERRQKYIENNK